MSKGIDVYQRFQGTIDWHQVAAAGVADVIVKLTNGPGPAAVRGDTYVHGAHGAGLKVGGYHYALGGSPTAQADAFAAELTRLGALDLAPALDFEDASLPADTADRRTWIVAFFARLKVRLPGLTKALLYSSGSELTAIGADSIALPGLLVLVWDAEYGPNDGGEHPVVHYTGRRAIHQYTSVGHVPGIGPAVDLDDITADITEDDVELTDPITYTDRATGTVTKTNVGEALGAAHSLFTQLTKGNGSAGGGPAGWWVNNFLDPDHDTLNTMAAQLAAIQGALSTDEAALLAAVKAQQAPTVDVSLADLEAAFRAVLGAGFDVSITPKPAAP